MDRRKFLHALAAAGTAQIPLTRFLHASEGNKESSTSRPLAISEMIVAIDFGCQAQDQAIGSQIIEISASEISLINEHAEPSLYWRGHARELLFRTAFVREIISRFETFAGNAVMFIHNAPREIGVPNYELLKAEFESDCFPDTNEVEASAIEINKSLPGLAELCALYKLKIRQKTLQIATADSDPLYWAGIYLGKPIRHATPKGTWTA